ncbi:g10505 [Coccomyxa viridis]|uniref:G10505 protein n=1 Tax=Coccomyxa viridis TaxID=1274662 RepID=A0ABP1G5G9_9CHLO
MDKGGDRWAPSEAPTAAAREPGHGAAGIPEARNKQRYESSVSERDYVLPQPGAYYEHDDREARTTGRQEAGRRNVDSRARPHERRERDHFSYDRGPDRDRSGPYRSRAPRDTGRWDRADLRRQSDHRRSHSSHRDRSPPDRHGRDRYVPDHDSVEHRAPTRRQQDAREDTRHATPVGPSVRKGITAASRDERSEKQLQDQSSAHQQPSQQAPQWRDNRRHDMLQGAAAAGGKWGHDKFQELGEDQNGADGGQYKSILGLF